jgi:signal transduction histidine kinase
MSTVARAPEAETGHAPRFSDRSWQLTAGAGVTLLAALAIALDAAPEPLVAAVACAGVALSIALLGRRAASVLAAHRELLILLVPIAAVLVWMATAVRPVQAAAASCLPAYPPLPSSSPCFPYVAWPWPIGHVPILPLVAMALAVSGGLVLVADAARVRLGLAPRQRAPWEHLTAPDSHPPSFAWRAVAGVLLVGFAAALAIGLVTPQLSAPGQPIPAWQLILLLVLVAAAAGAVIGVPLLIGSRMRFDRDRGAVAREHERQRFAAHLHDSVLQTLALVQRQAHDPAAVTRLARRQEHALRAWMAGEAELRSDTLVSALRDAVAAVEDEEGITVELTAIGDRPIDHAGESLVAAAREAWRNAARHAPAASVVIFAEISAGRTEVFVRDDGPGFMLEEVVPERRGIRDAIIGRMASAGGSASVESAPGEGTEVALRLGAGNGRR